MATLTLRDLDDSLKEDLRVGAALQGRSMEEEARQILRQALRKDAEEPDLVARIRSRFVVWVASSWKSRCANPCANRLRWAVARLAPVERDGQRARAWR